MSRVAEINIVEVGPRDGLQNEARRLPVSTRVAFITALAGATFDFGIGSLDRRGVVNLLRVVEATGTEAYLGAIPFFATNAFLAVAGGIQATEARHTAVITAIQNRLFGTDFPTAPLANDRNGIDRTDLTPDQVLAAVSGPNGFVVLP